LVAAFPEGYSDMFNTPLPTGPPLLNVTTIATADGSDKIFPPSDWTWESIVDSGVVDGSPIGTFSILPDEFVIIGDVIIDGWGGKPVLNF
jgi:hypothetical protein